MSDTNRIGLDSFTSRAAQLGNADAALRLSKNTGDVTTAEHGFLSKAVRFFFGPTKQDIADNTKLFRDFHKNLSDQFGSDIATSALMRVRQDAKLDGDALLVRVGKPLTAHQVRTAVAFAQHTQTQDNLTRDEAKNQAIDAAIVRYVPGSPEFAKVTLRLGLDIDGFTEEQTDFVTQRLKEEVTSLVETSGSLPDTAGLQSLVRKVARRADEIDPAEMDEFRDKVDTLRESAGRLVDALSGADDANPMKLVGDILRESDDLAKLYLTSPGDVGLDDRVKPFEAAIRHVVAQLSPDEARSILANMRDPHSAGYKTIVAQQSLEGQQDPIRTAAIGQIGRVLTTTLASIAQRGGVPDAAAKLDERIGQALDKGTVALDDDVQDMIDAADKPIRGRMVLIDAEYQASLAEDQAQYARDRANERADNQT